MFDLEELCQRGKSVFAKLRVVICDGHLILHDGLMFDDNNQCLPQLLQIIACLQVILDRSDKKNKRKIQREEKKMLKRR